MEFIEKRIKNKVHTKKMLELAKKEDTVVFVWGTGLLGTGNGYQILQKNNIKIDYFCDSNQEKQGQIIADDIMCISPQAIRQYDNVICFVMVGVYGVESVAKTLEDWGIVDYVTYDELIADASLLKEYFPFMAKSQIAIYTCISGGYDNLMEPEYISDECDYYCISDEKISEQSIYKWLDINQFLPNEELDNTRKNRYCKINSHIIFPEYKYTIYVDGNIEIINDISMCISDIGKCKMAVAGKTSLLCAYLEAIRCIEAGKDTKENITKHIEKYYREGFPRYWGTCLCNVLVREHMSDECIKIMEEWWTELRNGCKRDQISLPYVLWKNGYRMSDVGMISDTPFDDTRYWKYHYNHGGKR